MSVASVDALLSRACLNHTESTVCSFSSGGCSSDVCFLEIGVHWLYLLLVSSLFSTVVFSMDTESLKHNVPTECLPICASTCTKLFVFSLTLNHFNFFLLSIFHHLAVKFALVENKIWSLCSVVTLCIGRLRNLTWVHSC